jgi:bifunctional non-homologous end joining protein LigD
MKWAKRSTGARDKASVPAGVVPPMHPTLVDKVPEGPNWLHEIKWDGYRIGVYLMGGKVRVLTRTCTIGRTSFHLSSMRYHN